MALRIHEIHPSVVHYPLALFPAAVVADVLGKLTGSRPLMRIGAALMPVAAASAAVAAGAGLVAQEAVRTKGVSQDMLETHRNLNLTLVVASVAMAVLRSRRQVPTAGYLAAGLAGVAAMNYTAYLGGKMVYGEGVGVEAAQGLRDGAAPELTRRTLKEAGRTALHHASKGLRHAVEQTSKGRIAPALRR